MNRPASLGAALALAAGLSSVSRGQALELPKPGTLRVLAVQSELFWNHHPKTLPGFDKEVLQGFVRLHDLRLDEIEVPQWPLAVQWLLEGKGDVLVAGYADNEERRKRVSFTSEVFPSREVVFSLAPHPVVTTLEQLRGEKVGTIRGTSMALAIAEAGVPNDNVVYLRSGSLPEGLRTGRISAAVLPIEHALLERRKDPSLQLGIFLGKRVSLAYAVRKDAPQLRDSLSEYIENLRKTPSWNKLLLTYLGEDAIAVLRGVRGE